MCSAKPPETMPRFAKMSVGRFSGTVIVCVPLFMRFDGMYRVLLLFEK